MAKLLVLLCHVALGLSYSLYGNNVWNNADLQAAILANALGGGLTGSVLVNSWGSYPSTNLFNTFVDSHSLKDSATSGLYLISQATPLNYQFNSAINTYLNANALHDDPRNFVVSGALSNNGFNGNFGTTYTTAALANAFGGGITGALLANQFTGNTYPNSGYYSYGGNFGPAAYSYPYSYQQQWNW